MNDFDCKIAEDDLVRIDEMLSSGATKEDIVKSLKSEKVKNLGAFFSIKGRSKMNKEELLHELLPKIKEYRQVKWVKFDGGVDTNDNWTSDASEAVNSFVFKVLYKGIIYHVVFKDGYPKAIERLFLIHGGDYFDTGVPNNGTANEVFELIETWFEKTPNKAHWL